MKFNGTVRPKNNFDIAMGYIGTILIIMAYLSLTMEWISHDSLSYNLMNLFGGGILLYRVWLDGNYANMIMELFFVGVAVLALLRFF